MNIFFWRKRKTETPPPEQLAWNLMFMATDPDKCWELASQFRKTGVPGNVLTCETSFLMASAARSVIRSALSEHAQRQALLSAEAAYAESFQHASEEEQPEEMLDFYKGADLRQVSAEALVRYGEADDFLPLTLPIFIHRIHGDPRMAQEIKPLIEERVEALGKAFAALVK